MALPSPLVERTPPLAPRVGSMAERAGNATRGRGRGTQIAVSRIVPRGRSMFVFIDDGGGLAGAANAEALAGDQWPLVFLEVVAAEELVEEEQHQRAASGDAEAERADW